MIKPSTCSGQEHRGEKGVDYYRAKLEDLDRRAPISLDSVKGGIALWGFFLQENQMWWVRCAGGNLRGGWRVLQKAPAAGTTYQLWSLEASWAPQNTAQPRDNSQESPAASLPLSSGWKHFTPHLQRNHCRRAHSSEQCGRACSAVCNSS